MQEKQKNWHLEILGGDVVYALLVDQDGHYMHNYQEDSYVANQNGLSLTIKARTDATFWVIVDEEIQGDEI